jgi:putative hemolysin
MDRLRGQWKWWAVAVLIVGCNVGVAAPSAAPTASGHPAPGDAAARDYCTQQGGKLVDRHAVANTNGDPSTWLRLAASQTFCEFESTADGNTTRISVDLVTLSSEAPTLAGLAYLSKVPPTLPETPSANPAAYDCDVGLNGAQAYGTADASSGGWVNEDEPVFSVMDMCVFADGSAIDEWGITYYAQGTVRGADLATKMRYQPGDRLPAVFPTRR